MALYHLHCDIIGRSGGRSATAAAAYRATCRIDDRTTGEIFDFTRKEKALKTAVILPADAPKWAGDRAELWNKVEEKESRRNSQFCRSFDIALQKELSVEQNYELVREWAELNYVRRGLAADVCIHAPHKNRDGTTNENLHAHVLIPTRKLDKNGWAEKDREANDRDFFQNVRASWADIVNAKFKELGISERIDARTLEAQGIDREPQQHQGAKATAMARRGETPDRKKRRQQEPQEKIIVTEKEVVDALLREGPEFKNLLLLLERAKAQEKKPQVDDKLKKELREWSDRISGMSPQEWQAFTKNYGKDGLVDEAYGEFAKTVKKYNAKAQVMWVEKNIAPLTAYFKKERTEKVKVRNDFVLANKRPPEEPTEYGLFGGKYRTSDGEKFGEDIFKARAHQRELTAAYDKKFTPLDSSARVAIREHEDCLKKNYGSVRENIVQHHAGAWLEKMLEGAKKIYLESPAFYPVRAMRAAYKSHKAQKESELAAFNAAKRMERARGRDRDRRGGNAVEMM